MAVERFCLGDRLGEGQQRKIPGRSASDASYAGGIFRYSSAITVASPAMTHR